MGIRNVSDTYFCEAIRSGSVPATGSTSELVGQDPERKGLIVYNHSPNPWFLKYGTSGSSDDFNTRLAADTEWTMPKPPYTGSIWGAGGAGAGSAATGSIKYLQLL